MRILINQNCSVASVNTTATPIVDISPPNILLSAIESHVECVLAVLLDNIKIPHPKEIYICISLSSITNIENKERGVEY